MILIFNLIFSLMLGLIMIMTLMANGGLTLHFFEASSCGRGIALSGFLRTFDAFWLIGHFCRSHSTGVFSAVFFRWALGH